LAEPRRSLLHLRFLSALHRQALAGQHPELARCYPSCGGTADPSRPGWRSSVVRSPKKSRRPCRPMRWDEAARCCLGSSKLRVARSYLCVCSRSGAAPD
jgi:hypothetical protein